MNLYRCAVEHTRTVLPKKFPALLTGSPQRHALGAQQLLPYRQNWTPAERLGSNLSCRAQTSRRIVLSSSMDHTPPFTIVGKGRVGQALREMGAGEDVLIGRGEPIVGPDGPIIVCTRNNDLQGVVEATSPERREDLVFIQNGMLQPWLDSTGLGSNTQVLVYFAVAKLGDKPTDGKTDVNPEGLTAATGKHAQAVADRLARGGLACKVLDRVAYQRAMLEKLIWICAFMVVGARHGCTVGEVESQHRDEVGDVIQELAAAGERELGIQLDPGCQERLNAYARAVSHFPTAVKEFEWRNGWFYGISRRELDAGRADPCPTHTALLKEVRALPGDA
uniref:Uncharacterized protein n=1 Tax=Tetraselmis sp. GSL018 TaxID=582737 RepID=A0A061SA93_9CHLO